MSTIQRTSQDFTTGIVNVPLNTPVTLFFISHNKEELELACSMFKQNQIPYKVDIKLHKQIVISETPVNRALAKRLKTLDDRIKTKSDYRYLFFELDDLQDQNLRFVLSIYQKYNLPAFYHRTMRGWHFMSVKPIQEYIWQEALTQLKPLNLACPHVTLRIRPNKWVDEADVWKDSRLFLPVTHTDTITLKTWIDNQYIQRLKSKYFIVNYRMTGELGNK